MVTALATVNPAHHAVDIGSPFYCDPPSPGRPLGGAPVFHKYDKPDFVTRFLADVAAASTTGERPSSLLAPVSTTIDPAVPAFDADAIDFLGSRFRKLFPPVHFRFYLAACELRCLVPGFPGPERRKVKKVELVIRRIALKRNRIHPPGLALAVPALIERDKEWAWSKIPDPSLFPSDPPEVTLQLAPRLTGNTHTWWPIPEGEPQLQDEQRFPMTRAAGPGIDKSRAIYFAFCPLGSGEMYGPRKDPSPVNPSTQTRIEEDVRYDQRLPLALPPDWKSQPDVSDLQDSKPPEPLALKESQPPKAEPLPGISPDTTAPRPLTKSEVIPPSPLVKAPSSYALTPATVYAWRRNFQKTLGLFSHNLIDGPRPKFEPPPITGNVEGGWGYVVRCVATIEVHPGCLVEHWGPASEPIVIAPHFDPFGGRPVQIEIPSLKALGKMLGGLSAAQLARRGGTPVAFRQPGQQPMVGGDPPKVIGNMPLNLICSFGIPLITICAYLMLSIALILLFPLKFTFSFLFSLKFCVPIPGPEED